MEEETRLTTTHGSALDVYGSGDDVKTLSARIKLCLPNGASLKDHEALALAQLSVAYTLNPFNGEVWYIPGKGPMVGIKGHRKAARKQAAYWIEHQLLSQAERSELEIPDSSIAYRCMVYRSDMIRQSAEAIKMMYDAGMKDAAERYAYKPSIGIGFWVKGESTRMKPDQVARKRAEAEALRQAFDLPFASEVGNGETVGYVDADEWRVSPDPAPAPDPERVEKTSSQLYGDPNFEGFGDEPAAPATPAPELDDELVDEADDEQPEQDQGGGDPDAPAITSPKELLAAVNAETMGHYNSIPHLLNAAKQVLGADWKWPTADDAGGYAEALAVLVDHANAGK